MTTAIDKLSELASLATTALPDSDMLEVARYGSGIRPSNPVRLMERVRRSDLELAHCRALLDKNLDQYRRLCVDPIVDKASAYSTAQSYSIDFLMGLNLSLAGLETLVSEMRAKIIKYGVEPTPPFANFKREAAAVLAHRYGLKPTNRAAETALESL